MLSRKEAKPMVAEPLSSRCCDPCAATRRHVMMLCAYCSKCWDPCVLHCWAQDVEPYVVVAGNPARVIRRLERPADGQ